MHRRTIKQRIEELGDKMKCLKERQRAGETRAKIIYGALMIGMFENAEIISRADVLKAVDKIERPNDRLLVQAIVARLRNLETSRSEASPATATPPGASPPAPVKA